MKDANDPVTDDHPAPVHVRSLFISDVHLGTRTARADELLDLLRSCEAETVYLVGRYHRLPARPARADLAAVPQRRAAEADAQGAQGHAPHSYPRQPRRLNNPLNWVRRHLGLGYWSLSAYLKNGVKKAVAFIGAFEEAVAAEARRREADGIICGHVHHASDRSFEGVHYLNCGDWVESCTAIIESHAGELRIIRWDDRHFGSEEPSNGFPVPLQAMPRPADAV